MYGHVYVLKNIYNGKRYVGQTTTTVKRRLAQHCRLSVYTDIRMPLLAAIRKYGIDAFVIETTIPCDTVDQLNNTEIKLIQDLKTRETGYNVRVGGQGMEIEDRQRMSAKMKIICSDPLWRKRISQQSREWFSIPGNREILSQAQRKLWANKDTKAMILAAMKKGRARPEIRKKMSDSQKLTWTPEKRKQYSDREKARCSDPLYRKKMSDRAHKYYKNRPELKEKPRIQMINAWKDPEQAAKITRAYQVAAKKKLTKTWGKRTISAIDPDGVLKTFDVSDIGDYCREHGVALDLILCMMRHAKKSDRKKGNSQGYRFSWEDHESTNPNRT